MEHLAQKANERQKTYGGDMMRWDPAEAARAGEQSQNKPSGDQTIPQALEVLVGMLEGAEQAATTLMVKLSPVLRQEKEDPLPAPPPGDKVVLRDSTMKKGIYELTMRLAQLRTLLIRAARDVEL